MSGHHEGRLIEVARRRAGLSQRDLAERSGTSAAAICLYERGERIPRVDTLRRVIAATGATLELAIREAPRVDLAANARALEDLLDLSDHLPKHHGRVLQAPVLASLALARSRRRG